MCQFFNLELPLESSARRKEIGRSVNDEELCHTQAKFDEHDQLDGNETVSMVPFLQSCCDRNPDGKWAGLTMTQITHMLGTEKEKCDTSKNDIPFELTFEENVMLPTMFLPLWTFLTLPNNPQ